MLVHRSLSDTVPSTHQLKMDFVPRCNFVAPAFTTAWGDKPQNNRKLSLKRAGSSALITHCLTVIGGERLAWNCYLSVTMISAFRWTAKEVSKNTHLQRRQRVGFGFESGPSYLEQLKDWHIEYTCSDDKSLFNFSFINTGNSCGRQLW